MRMQGRFPLSWPARASTRISPPFKVTQFVPAVLKFLGRLQFGAPKVDDVRHLAGTLANSHFRVSAFSRTCVKGRCCGADGRHILSRPSNTCHRPRMSNKDTHPYTLEVL